MTTHLPLRPARPPLIFEPLVHIVPPVPPHDREAEAGAADRQVGIAAGAFGLQRLGDAGAGRQLAPAAVRLLAEHRIAGLLRAIAESAAFADDRFGPAVAVQVAIELD